MLSLFRFFRWWLALWPLGLSRRVAGTVGQLVGRFCPRERAIARAQLQLALATSPEAAEGIIDQSFSHAGQALIESLLIPKLLAAPKPRPDGLVDFPGITVDGVDCLAEIKALQSSCIILSAHIGSIELLAAHHAAQGRKVGAIGRYPNYPALGVALEELRRSYGIEPVWRHDPASMRKLISILRGGHSLAVLIDQDANLENGFAPFFNRPAAAPITPLKLAFRSRLPIYTGFALRTAAGHRFIYQPLPYSAVEEAAAVSEILLEFNQRFEKLLREHPGQWFWWHRRWRRRPGVDYTLAPEELRSTAEYLEWLAEGARD